MGVGGTWNWDTVYGRKAFIVMVTEGMGNLQDLKFEWKYLVVKLSVYTY